MRYSFPAIVGLSLLLPLGCTEPPKPEKAQDLDKIESADGKSEQIELGPIPDGAIAKVGDVEIPNGVFREIYDLKIKKYADRGREIPPSADRRYRKSITERLIYHEVLAQEAKALGVDYDQAELASRDEQQRRGIREWDKHLERRGETDKSLEDMVIAELREKAILVKLGKLEVTEAEIDEDYDKIKGNWKSDKPRVQASHILVPIGPQADVRAKADGKVPEPSEDERTQWEAEALAKAKEIHALVTAEGADFAKIATEKSTGPSAAKGGDIGIFTADRMAEEFSAVAFALEAGQVSEPVKTKFGYHIIKVTGKWPPGELPKEALVDQIRERLEQRKLHQGRRELKEELLAKYTIVDNIEPTLGPEPKRGGRRMRGEGKGPRKLGPKAREGKGAPRAALDRDAVKGMRGAPPSGPEK
ncbi:peptidylprolyl isomerase [Paraliomyxa miuraensis]|uniref:peptidylprolyl isomerase n=1 Tax=Paraliomyxa miuraensis TaxID=376150 RepID=UPI00224EBBCA|nr:peptidylprolyl isomerase [Paraliomyxa miuraensis]MCX4239952.1 peptidylprolyl isomerase [Paraliomyxa miuraensis]